MSKWVGLLIGVVLVGNVEARNYADVQQFLRETAGAFRQNATVFDLGLSDSGEVIQGIKIGSGTVKTLVVATHHGNEYGSTEVAKGVVADLASSPIVGQTVYVIPVLNIGGYNLGQRREPAGKSTFDPNRDYPGPCGTDGPFHLKSTKLLADFVEREGVVTSATLHTFAPAVLYPWGISTRDTSTEYDDLFIGLGNAAVVESNYPVGNSTRMLYPADGTFEDYSFWKHGMWSMLFELGMSHNPSQESIREMVRVNVPGIRRMLIQAPTQRAERHAFTGKCDSRMRILDRREE